MTKTRPSARRLRMPIGWHAKVMLEQGIGLTYPWVADQVRLAREARS